LTIELIANTGTNIPINTEFVGVANGVIYKSDAAVISVLNLATINITAIETGALGNLSVGDELKIVNPIPGSENSALVSVELVTGAENETDILYRTRILDRIRQTIGGGNAADYRRWSEEVSGVARAFPYSGLPYNSILISSPPDRTIYVEATPDIDPDGIAPAGILTSVRASITTDPITGESRQPLGLTDSTLYVESIYRTDIYIQISNLSVPAALLSQVKDDIETEITNYLLSLRPYIDGLDISAERNDVITTPSVSEIVQSVVAAVGGNFQAAGFGLVFGSTLPLYQLGEGELAKIILPITYL
jgi:hypothetical protein